MTMKTIYFIFLLSLGLPQFTSAANTAKADKAVAKSKIKNIQYFITEYFPKPIDFRHIEILESTQDANETNCNNSTLPCSGHGRCLSDGTCICDAGYTTHDSVVPCNYERAIVTLAFVLAVIPFTGVLGVGWFVLGYAGMGAGQLLYFIPGVCVIPPIAVFLGLKKDDVSAKGGCCGGCLMCGWVCGLIIFYIWTVVTIGFARVYDDQGVKYAGL